MLWGKNDLLLFRGSLPSFILTKSQILESVTMKSLPVIEDQKFKTTTYQIRIDLQPEKFSNIFYLKIDRKFCNSK